MGKHHRLGRIIKWEDNIMMNIYIVNDCPCSLYFTRPVRIRWTVFNVSVVSKKQQTSLFAFDLAYLFVCLFLVLVGCNLQKKYFFFNIIGTLEKATKTNDTRLVIKHIENMILPAWSSVTVDGKCKVAIEDPRVISEASIKYGIMQDLRLVLNEPSSLIWLNEQHFSRSFDAISLQRHLLKLSYYWIVSKIKSCTWQKQKQKQRELQHAMG